MTTRATRDDSFISCNREKGQLGFVGPKLSVFFMKRMVSCEEIFENEKKNHGPHTHTHTAKSIQFMGAPKTAFHFNSVNACVCVCVYLYFSLPLITLSFALFFLYDFMQATVLCMCPCT